MTDEDKTKKDGSVPFSEGYQPVKKSGYTPIESNADPDDPPKGGSGVNRESRSNENNDESSE